MSVQAALIACRLLQYGAAMLLFGAGLFIWGLAPSRLSALLAKSGWRIMDATIVLLGLTTLCWLLFEAGLMGEGWFDAINPDIVTTVLFDTAFGHAWLVHGAICIGLLTAILMRRATATMTASALALASLGLVGHAVMRDGPLGWFHRANLAAHLLSGGFWLGGLVPLVPALRLTRDPGLRHDAMIALRRFSRIGHIAVAAVIVTGMINTALIVGLRDLDGSSPYQRLLAAKVALVGLMAGLALFNRYRLVPGLRDRPAALHDLVRSSVAEIVLGVFVIALVSLFGLLQPHA